MKSLKLLFKEDAIKKEVKTWTMKECKEYINKHEKSKNEKSKLLQKKLRIVNNFYNNFEEGIKSKGNKRKELLAGIPLKNLVEHAPIKAKDSTYSELKNIGNSKKNTGIYLWKEGFDPVRFLGKGANGVVWECENNKALKVTCNSSFGPVKTNAVSAEIKDVKKLGSIISNDKYPAKAKKYLAVPELKSKSTSRERAIIESELAPRGNLEVDIKKHSKYTIDEIIKMAKQALKGLHVIHKEGYSHNDIKPDNFLVVDKEYKELKNKKRAALKVADFGAMTKIDKTYKIFVNSKFCAPDIYLLSPKAVSKRDSYSLGAVLLFLLIGDNNLNYKNVAKELVSKNKDNKDFFDKYNLIDKYGADNFNKINDFLNVIKGMVAPKYNNRLSIDEALEKMKSV